MTSQSEPSSRKGRPYRRRQYIVDKPFQYRLIFVLLMIWGVNSLFSSIVLYYFYETYVQYFYRILHWEAIASVRFQTTIGFITIFGLGLVAVLGAYLSSQIAGPLYRLKVSMERVAQGDINFEVRFRDRDFLRDFPDYFNNMLKRLKEQTASDAEALRAIEAELEDPRRARMLLQELRQKKEDQLGFTPPESESSQELPLVGPLESGAHGEG